MTFESCHNPARRGGDDPLRWMHMEAIRMKKTMMAFALAGAVVMAQPLLACDMHKTADKTKAETKTEQKAEAGCCMTKGKDGKNAKSEHCEMKEHKTAAKSEKKSDEKSKSDAKPAAEAKATAGAQS